MWSKPIRATDKKASIGQLKIEDGIGFFSRRCRTRIAKKGIPKAAFIVLLVRIGAGAGAGAATRGAAMLTTLLSLQIERQKVTVDVILSPLLSQNWPSRLRSLNISSIKFYSNTYC